MVDAKFYMRSESNWENSCKKKIQNYYNEDTQDKFRLQITRMWTTLPREIALSRYI